MRAACLGMATILFLQCAAAILFLQFAHAVGSNAQGRSLKGTVAFATVGRAHYGFDIFLLELPSGFVDSKDGSLRKDSEARLSDGVSVNYNGQLVDFSERAAVLQALNYGEGLNFSSHGMLVYVSERDGSAQIHFNLFFERRTSDWDSINIAPWSSESADNTQRRIASELNGGTKAFIELGPLSLLNKNEDEPTALHDRPALVRGKVIFMSTREPRSESRQSWMAVYSMDITTGKTIRLTPEAVTDYSPSVSPSGKWVMVASNQGRGWGGEIKELDTDLYVFKAHDGSERKLVARGGGWPSWADDSTVYFHRKAEDGWWSIFKVTFSESQDGPVEAERITPPGVHAFTPAASRTGKWIAVATRRPDFSEYRHIEIFVLSSRSFVKLTEQIVPDAHHYNPFVAPDSDKIGYHRCRGKTVESVTPRLEHIKSPVEGLALVRVDGDFPVFSPDGQHIAFIPDLDVAGIYVTRLDGTGKTKIFNERAFGLSWDKQRKGVLYTSYGVGFQSEDTTVHIVSILNADKLINGEAEGVVDWKILTKNGTSNNAFPSVSPDGKWVVFRSGRSGHKNLYIMDAIHGEDEGSLRRLTEGAWTDTMASWSHDGEWIAFSSDRHNPGGGSFALYFIHPNGTGLHRVLNSSTGGRVNHPFFSPDSKSLVFTTDYAGVSAEPVSVPHQFQPYGEIFLAKIDGSELKRLTHNSYEDGTPSWGPEFSDPKSDGERLKCGFADCRFLGPPSGEDLKATTC